MGEGTTNLPREITINQNFYVKYRDFFTTLRLEKILESNIARYRWDLNKKNIWTLLEALLNRSFRFELIFMSLNVWLFSSEATLQFTLFVSKYVTLWGGKWFSQQLFKAADLFFLQRSAFRGYQIKRSIRFKSVLSAFLPKLKWKLYKPCTNLCEAAL